MNIRKYFTVFLAIVLMITQIPVTYVYAGEMESPNMTVENTDTKEPETIGLETEHALNQKEQSETIDSEDIDNKKIENENIAIIKTESEKTDSSHQETMKEPSKDLDEMSFIKSDDEKIEDDSLPNSKHISKAAAGTDTWELTWSETSNSIGDTINYQMTINFGRDPSNTNNRDKIYQILVRSDYFSNKGNIAIESPQVTLKDGTLAPVFHIVDKNKTVTVGGISYYVYEAQYNMDLDDPDTGSTQVIVTSNISLNLSIKKEEVVEVIKKPVVIQDEEEVLIESGEIKDEAAEVEILKTTRRIYRKQADGTYKEVAKNVASAFHVEKDDIIEYQIKVKNVSNKELKDLKVYEDPGAGLEFFQTNIPFTDGSVITDVNKDWSLSASPLGAYEYGPELTIAPGGVEQLKFYMKVKDNGSSNEDLKNHAIVTSEKEHIKEDTWSSVITGEDYYDLQLIAGFTGLNGETRRELKAQKPEENPLSVLSNDELMLSITIMNRGVNAVKNIKTVLYLPEFLTSQSYASMKPYAGVAPAEAQWKKLTLYELTGSVDSQLGGVLNPGDTITIQVPIKVGDLSSLDDIHGLYGAAEIYYFEDSLDASKNTKDATIEDRDSTPDQDPYNDLTKGSGYREISSGKKELDNHWSGNVKNNPEQDEDDFDFFFAQKEEDPDSTDNKIHKVRESKKEAERFLAELSDKSHVDAPGITFPDDLVAMNDEGKISGFNDYILYSITVNKDSRMDINGDIVITDILPEGLNMLSGTVGGTKRYAISFQSSAAGAQKVYDDQMTGLLTIDEGDQKFTLVIPESSITGNGVFHQSKEFELRFLVSVNAKKAQQGQVYKNSVHMQYNSETISTSEETSAQWGVVNSSSGINKLVYNEESGKWLDTNELNILAPDQKQIKYRLVYTSAGFVQLGNKITDYLEKSDKIQGINVDIKGYNGVLNESGEIEQLIPLSKDKNVFTYEIDPDYSKVIFSQNEDIYAYQVYYLDITIDYSDIIPGEIIENSIGNNTVHSLKPLSLEMEKTDQEGNLLLGSEFELYYANNLWEINDKKPVKDLEQKNIIVKPGTSQSKIIFIPEDYSQEQEWYLLLKEVKTPVGYEKNQDKTFRLKVLKDGKGNLSWSFEGTIEEGKLEDSKLTIINEKLEKVPFEFKKVDESGNPLSGATFQLVSPDGTLLQATSDVSGKVVFEDLLPGTYTLSEGKAPEGYKKIDITWSVIIVENEDVKIIENHTGKEIKDLVVVNEKIKEPSTGDPKDPVVPKGDEEKKPPVVPGKDPKTKPLGRTSTPPTGTRKTTAVKTSDESSMMKILLLLGISGVVLGVCYKGLRRKKSIR